MDPSLAIVPSAPPPAAPATLAPARETPLLRSVSAWAALGSGFLAIFTTPVVGGDLPLGEIVLTVCAGWAIMCMAVHHAWPGPLFRLRWLQALLAAQGVAFAAYVASDLYRRSLPGDLARGWSRMILLAIDLFAIAYLFGRSPRNWLVFQAGLAAGQTASALVVGPIFGDLWKFGVAAPITWLACVLASTGGPLMAFLATTAMGIINFLMDYRGLGGLCLVTSAATLLQILPRRSRLWIAPALGAAAVLGLMQVYHRTSDGNARATRSDVERSAMMTASIEAIRSSPLIGQGSWFSNSHVFDQFNLIRHVNAKRAGVGGFPEPNEQPGLVAVHSQLLTALAEGGIFGGLFFMVFGAGLTAALFREVFARRWQGLSPLTILLLLGALWNLLFSPFSGAHRVYIAAACGLVLLQFARPLPAADSRDDV